MASADLHDKPRVTWLAVEEELANSISHGIGLVLSLAGFFALVTLAVLRGGVWHIVGVSVYGASLVTLYLASTAYHGVSRPRIKRALRTADHIAIYLLIAGTYTPFTLISLHGAWGWTLFGIVWGLALLGIVMKLAWRTHPEALSLGVYLVMGWVCIIAIKPILETLPIAAFAWLLAGGLAYSIGTIFYIKDSRPYFHTIWHFFVILGSALHFYAVMFYVLPMAIK